MSGNKSRDRFTFQYAELKRGNAAAQAVASIAHEFVQSYEAEKHFEALLNAIVVRLAESEAAESEAAWHALTQSLMARQHAILEAERARERRPKKWMPNKPVRNTIEESSDDEPEEELTPEEQLRREEEKRAKEKAEEAEQQRIAAEMYEKEQKRLENERQLAARARQVDAKAFEEKLKSGGVVLLNAGKGRGKKGGGAKDSAALSAEEVGNLHREVIEAVKARERLRVVVSSDEEELPGKIEEAKKELAKVEADVKARGALENKKAKEMAKGQITQLQQKLSKQTIEKNRLALQLKAMEPNPLREELNTLLESIDKLVTDIELSE